MTGTVWTPPHVEVPEEAPKAFEALKAARECAIRAWPRAVYEDGFFRPPAGALLIVSDEAALKAILIDRTDIFLQSPLTRRILRPVWREGIASSEGEQWRWQRRAAAPVFTPGAVQSVIPIAERAGLLLSRRWREAAGPVDLFPDLADAVTQVVFDAFLADEGEEAARAAFSQAGNQLTDEMAQTNLADIFQLPNWMRPLMGKTARTPGDALHRIVADVLVRRMDKQVAGQSLLAMLAKSTDPETSQAMSHALLVDNIVGSLAAGRETTALALAWTLWLIANHAPTRARLEEELAGSGGAAPLDAAALERHPFARQVLMEALRLYPPAPIIMRACQEPFDLGGETARPGDMILIPIYALHRRPDFWEAPDVFDPERFATGRFDARAARFRYLPFGAGPRICLGMQFALSEAHAILVALLRTGLPRPAGDRMPGLETGATLRPDTPLRVLYG
ncbi:MAG: cytochrome P450 [Hyphomonas sp.]